MIHTHKPPCARDPKPASDSFRPHQLLATRKTNFNGLSDLLTHQHSLNQPYTSGKPPPEQSPLLSASAALAPNKKAQAPKLEPLHVSPVKSFGLGDTLSVVAIQSPTRVQQQLHKRMHAFHSTSSTGGGKKGEAVIIHRQELTFLPLAGQEHPLHALKPVKHSHPSADHSKIFNVPSLQQ